METVIFYLLALILIPVLSDDYSYINLPVEHLSYYFTRFPEIYNKCRDDETCPYKAHLNQEQFWGYEYDHKWGKQYKTPTCPGDHKGWVKTKFDQLNTFYTQTDFGYIKDQLKEMKVLCEPLFADDSSLECSEHLRFCRGRNIMINFTKLAYRDEPIRYKMDVLGEGDISGYCDFYKDKLDEQCDHISPLQSWGPELRYFTKLKRRPIINGDCDVVVERPTYIVKIDATVNMYHHFCDFLNLYASLHINASRYDAFSTDVNILVWETFTYRSSFEKAWRAFTHHPILDLKTFRGKTVCFKNVVFPLLPRMIFGLYYNTPVIYGCEGSGLFQAFSEFFLHRLEIPLLKRKDKKVRITFLSRDTRYRRILNEKELIDSIKNNKDYSVQRVVYNKDISFEEQLKISRNTDVLIGIHGAGLTHLLFLPEWAAVFELYNCEDPNCYSDLARLRGVKYVTWEDVDKLISEEDGSHEGGAHAKFANYYFDVDEFKGLVKKAAKHVQSHPKFKEHLERQTFNKETLIHEDL